MSDHYDSFLKAAWKVPALPALKGRLATTAWSKVTKELKTDVADVAALNCLKEAVILFLDDFIDGFAEHDAEDSVPLASVKRALQLWYMRSSVDKADKDAMVEGIAEKLQEVRTSPERSPSPALPHKSPTDAAKAKDYNMRTLYRELLQSNDALLAQEEEDAVTVTAQRQQVQRAQRVQAPRIFDEVVVDEPLQLPADILFTCEKWPSFPKKRVYDELAAYFLDARPQRRDDKDRLSVQVQQELYSLVRKILPSIVESVYDAANSSLFQKVTRQADLNLQEFMRKRIIVTHGAAKARQFSSSIESLNPAVPLWYKAATSVTAQGFQNASPIGATEGLNDTKRP